jgi:hypothetical protein
MFFLALIALVASITYRLDKLANFEVLHFEKWPSCGVCSATIGDWWFGRLSTKQRLFRLA